MNECFDCDEGCSSCSFVEFNENGIKSKCDMCDEGLVLTGWTCQSCPSGTAKVGKVCQDCPEYCNFCENDDLACSSCESGYELY